VGGTRSKIASGTPGSRFSLADRLAARDPHLAWRRAQLLRDDGEAARAFQLAVIAARAGLPAAEAMVGSCYLTGAGVARNGVEAGRWFLRAAEAGDVGACRDLAGLHLFGLREADIISTTLSLFGATEASDGDFDAALRWALVAAQAGDADAQVMAGFIYVAGPPALRDIGQARHWYARAAAAGAARGHLGLGVITLLEAATDAATFAAVEHINKAAAAELGAAFYYLGVIHERGIGVLADAAAAAAHYARAAAAGIRNAQAKYGFARLHGIGVTANAVDGETWLRRAALAGDPEAAALVAGLYAASGAGVALPPNYAEAAL
jgi:TPR repeat protein